MDKMMLQEVMTAPKQIMFREIPVPEPGVDQVLVKIMKIGVCGSDIHVYHGTHPFTSYPVTQGHEVSAKVVSCGANVTQFKEGQKVTFTADAYRRRFKGVVKQIRKAATTTNNVVTFPVIIEAENPGEMLFPGMTATLSIETARKDGAVATAAAAFRFRPKPEDLERVGETPRGRKIWLKPLQPGAPLEYVSVSEGVSDETHTEIVADNADALVGREAVVGYHTAATAGHVAPVAFGSRECRCLVLCHGHAAHQHGRKYQ